jgi:hypothetical protein
MKTAVLSLTFAFLLGVIPSVAQVFTLELPDEPVDLPAGASEVVAIFGDSAGRTLYVVRYMDSLLNRQTVYDLWIMVRPNGRVIATRRFLQESGYPIQIVSFSAERILAQVDESNGVVIRAFSPRNGDFVSPGTVLNMEVDNANGEFGALLTESNQRPPRHLIDTVVRRDNKVVRIQRFNRSLLRLTPD